MSDNIVGFEAREDGENRVLSEVVARCLRELLVMAENDNLVGVTIAAELADGSPHMAIAGSAYTFQTIGVCEFIKADILERLARQ